MQLQGSHSHSQIVFLWVLPLPSTHLIQACRVTEHRCFITASTSAVSEGLATFEVVTKITMQNADKI